jgi:NAD(P)H-dependent FMN reductase
LSGQQNYRRLASFAAAIADGSNWILRRRATLKLHTIITSVRPTRIGPAIARWFHDSAVKHGKFDGALIDLVDFKLPVHDEPEHPRLGKYVHEHTRTWSASVAAADAFAFVIPEYNYGMPPSLLNALTFLSREWAYKPCAFVSYGGLSGGTRAVQFSKQIVTTLKMMPMVEGVAIPMVFGMLSQDKQTFTPNELITTSALQTLDELAKWAPALKTMR